ncbi:MAG: cysteine--tRNA ligase [Candidatus Altiarchaeota archaeon]|nr:cysteine--tRNA ligase [Candidatus Altiarchaeota archaeon]
MTLSLYNTLSGRIEEFKPVREGQVGVYVCGLTVYDDMHIGHARTYLAFDVILRYLKYSGYNVTYVQNVTDVDDKIIKRAREREVDPLQLSREYALRSREDQKALNLLEADVYPTVSSHIADIIAAVEKLIASGHAYVADGSVYFDVSTALDYGKLSRQDTEHLSRHRIEPNSNKRNPLDFSLWKKSGKGELGFDSPWGFGRPGWHIECSVMSAKYLGGRFDIHGGALDLVFPHHENEIAQSEALSGEQPFVKYWLHTGFLNSSGEKMSKSLGNILPVREFLKSHSAQSFRAFILQTHYRSPVDYREGGIDAAGKSVARLGIFRRNLSGIAARAHAEGGSMAKDLAQRLSEDFTLAMDDDFNTPRAFAAVFDFVRGAKGLKLGNESQSSLASALGMFDSVTGVLGLGLSGSSAALTVEERKLVEERDRYRAEKNWVESDHIRDELARRGIKLVDTANGTQAAWTG